MKKMFPIIGHVFLGVMLLVFFFLVSMMFIGSSDYNEYYLWISLALSITLSIIIPIRRYKRAIKNKERLSLEVNNIESLKNELNQLSQDDPNRKTKEEELKKLENTMKKEKPVGIIKKISVITVMVLFWSATPMMVLYVAYPFLGGPVVTIIGLGWFVMVYVIFKHPKLVEKEMKRNAKYNIKY